MCKVPKSLKYRRPKFSHSSFKALEIDFKAGRFLKFNIRLLTNYSSQVLSMKKACDNFGSRYLRFVELSFMIHVVLFFCIQYTNNIVWPFVTLLLQHMYTFTHCLPYNTFMCVCLFKTLSM